MKYGGREAGIYRVGSQDFEFGRITAGTILSPTTIVIDFKINDNGTSTFSGDVTAPAYFESSDLRKKKVIDYEYKNGKIGDIKARLYEKNGKIEVGYFAQDLQGVLDSAVYEENGYLNLSYRQVHTAKIATLEERMTTLESKIKNL
jgi:hypothetical protein